MATFARRLWRRIESVHAVTYFAPESTAGAGAIGVRGFWRCYFGFRAAPLGACSAGPVTAAFSGFAPSMVERAVPSIWNLASPEALLDARAATATAALRRMADEALGTALSDGCVLETLAAAVDRGQQSGRPLFAANRSLPRSDDPVTDLWQLATTLREHRGDGHIAAWTASGLSALEVAVLFVADGGTTRASLQPNRGWTDDEWADTTSHLEQTGLIDTDGATAAGIELRRDVEATTDRLAAAPFEPLGDDERERLLVALDLPARAIAASGTIPNLNPMGVPIVT